MSEREVQLDSRRRLSTALRRLREKAGKSPNDVAREMSWSVSKLIRIERGTVSVSIGNLRALLRNYNVTDKAQVESLLELAKTSRPTSWWSKYGDLFGEDYLRYLAKEELAGSIYTFGTDLIPQLLQTDEYAMASMRGRPNLRNPAAQDEILEFRNIHREQLFSRPEMDLYLLLDETLVRQVIGNRDVMERQILHLQDLSEEDNVSIRILPSRPELYGPFSESFTIHRSSESRKEETLLVERPEGFLIAEESSSSTQATTGNIDWGLFKPSNYRRLFSELWSYTSAEETNRILNDILAELRLSGPGRESPGIDEIPVVIYLDTDDEEKSRRVLLRVDYLVRALGYGNPIDIEEEYGSLFRRSKAKALQMVTSKEFTDLVQKIERGLELAGLESRQAQVDHDEAQAVSLLLAEIKDIPRACIRAGSIVLIKYATKDGPVLMVRTLSQLEIRALDKYPEIQKNPERLLDSLTTAVDSLEPLDPEIPEPPTL